MNNELSLLVKDIPQDDVELFSKNTVATIDAKKVVDKITVDYSWVDVLDESIPYLDNIIRNPRRFIVSEEDIVPIEKTKKVAEESIKHLAVHTNLIQDVDEDGMVKPIKLLNVFKEETIDLYENRFIKSLVDNLFQFVNTKLQESDQRSYAKINDEVTYNGIMKKNGEEVNISLKFDRKYSNNNKQIKKIVFSRINVLNRNYYQKVFNPEDNTTTYQEKMSTYPVVLSFEVQL